MSSNCSFVCSILVPQRRKGTLQAQELRRGICAIYTRISEILGTHGRGNIEEGTGHTPSSMNFEINLHSLPLPSWKDDVGEVKAAGCESVKDTVSLSVYSSF